MDPRYVSNNLTQALAHLIEECGEVITAAGKTLRFGAASVNPELPPTEQETNAAWVLRELCDVEKRAKEIRERLRSEGFVDDQLNDSDAVSRATGLTFDLLRTFNTARLANFKTRDGKLAHKHADGSDWSINDWIVAFVGEFGEAANKAKKIRRGDMSLSNPHDVEQFGDELADAAIYLDIIAFRSGISLGEAVARKWNKTSAEIGWPARLPETRRG